MAYDAILNAEVAPDMAMTSELGQKIKDNFDYLYSQIGSGSGEGVPNGDFEIDADGDGLPDVWTISTYSGGSASLDTVAPAAGEKCLKFVHPGGAGNGGGYADSNFLSFKEFAMVSVWTKATAACKNQLIARYYDKNKAYLGEDIIDERTATPATWTLLVGSIANHALGAAYVKIRLVGGYTDTNVPASIYFDKVGYSQSLPDKILFPIEFTEVSTSSGSFVDVASQAVNVPMIANNPAPYIALMIKVRIEVRHSTGVYNCYCRLRIGSTYGTAVEVIQPVSYTQVDLPMSIDSAGQDSGNKTLYIQAYRGTSGTAYARKTSGYGFVELEIK